MILIADSGSTKTDWILIGNGEKQCFKTMGYNPYFINSESIYLSLTQSLVPQIGSANITGIYFYGAGCSNNENVNIVKKALSRCFLKSEVMVGHDMLAAARALLGDQPGFAAIIGTGSNTCLYDGRNVSLNIDSLGYLLGDEGSGSYIGKKLVRDYLRGYLPPDLDADFKNTYNHLTQAQVFDSLYNKPLPNRFLASFCMFADKHKADPYVQRIVFDSFSDFFANLVSKYPGYSKYSFNCVGSVASAFSKILVEVAEKYRMQVGRIINSPIDDLVKYHMRQETA
jgi:N-acetylglucosamine kinase-like BadF-type ATPase